MSVFLLLAMPCVIAQLLCPHRALLQPRRGAVMTVLAGVAILMVASRLTDLSDVLVPVAFGLGVLAATSIIWTSSYHLGITVIGGFGAVANFIPIAVHGSMPVVASSRQFAVSAPIHEPSLLGAKHQEIFLEDMHPVVAAFSDWVPVPGHGVISPGDVALLVAFLALGIHVRRISQPAPVFASRRGVRILN